MVEGKPIESTEYRGRKWKDCRGRQERYFEIARGSALECAAIQDVLVVGKALEENKRSDDYEFVYQVKVEALKEYIAKTWGWDDTVQRDFSLGREIIAGVTVGLIALPLALALGIASVPTGTDTPLQQPVRSPVPPPTSTTVHARPYRVFFR